MYEEIAEVVAESDEVLMEEYFNGEKFTREELLRGVTAALLEGDAVPLLVGSAEKGIGIDILLNTIVNYMPAPDDERAHTGFRYESGEERSISSDEPFSAVVFKTITDPYVGKISVYKVLSGTMTKETGLFNASQEKDEKNTGPFIIRGKDQFPVEAIHAGDIGAIGKLTATKPATPFAIKHTPWFTNGLKCPNRYTSTPSKRHRKTTKKNSPPLFANYKTKIRASSSIAIPKPSK